MNYCFDEIIERRYSNSTKWNGRDEVIAMWIADMDFKTDAAIIAALNDCAAHGIFGYSYPDESVYAAIIDWQQRRHNLHLQKDDILFSPAVVPSIGILIQSLSNQGDAILINDPVYPPFKKMIERNQRRVISSPFNVRDGKFYLDFEDIERKIRAEKVTMLLFCNPQNPGGRVWHEDELQTLRQLCKQNEVILVSDEIHQDIIFSDNKFTSLLTLCTSEDERVISMTSVSKTFNLAGVKNSLIFVKNAALRAQIVAAQEKIDMADLNTFGYQASKAAYRHGEKWLQQLIVYLQKNIAFLDDFISKNIPKIKVMIPEGGYLVWLDCRALNMRDEQLRQHFLNYGVELNAGIDYGSCGSGHVRINVACPHSLLQEALQRMQHACNALI